ncbi:MAG: hypothetical protein AAFN70_11540, partial [Planctomycetota bacterium]
NGYANAEWGEVRPYFSNQPVAKRGTSDYADIDDALGGWQFVNPDTFQIIGPGRDGRYGQVSVSSGSVFGNSNANANDPPVYFQYPTGRLIVPRDDVNNPAALVSDQVSTFKTTSEPFSEVEDLRGDDTGNFLRGSRLADDVEED